MASTRKIIVNGKGMVTIPYQLRRSHNIKKGTEVAILEIDGNITIVPIPTLEELEASRDITREEMEAAEDESIKQELELEK